MTEAGRGAEQGWEIRDLESQEEFQAVVRLQEEIWGEGFAERVPTAILGIAAKLGGVVAAAFLEGESEPAGFVFGLTGLEEGRPVHWSDMLAVRRGARGVGLAQALKLHQRRRLLSLGVRRMYWTFDPLEARNAHLNLNRLGARVRTYVEEMYGVSTSPLHQGIGTDRFVALWELDAPWVTDRVEGRAAGGDRASGGRQGREGARETEEALNAGMGPGGHPVPGEPRLDLRDDRLLVAVPTRIQELKAEDPELARRWRLATRQVLSHYLGQGWEVRALVAEGGGGEERPGGRATARYLLVRGG